MRNFVSQEEEEQQQQQLSNLWTLGALVLTGKNQRHETHFEVYMESKSRLEKNFSRIELIPTPPGKFNWAIVAFVFRRKTAA